MSSSATVVLAGALGALGGAVFALGSDRSSKLITGSVLGATAIATVAFMGGAAPIGIPPVDWRIPFAPGKEASRFPDPDQAQRFPSATAEIQIWPSMEGLPFMGGEFARSEMKRVSARAYTQDGTAPSLLFENAAELDRFPFLDDSQAGSA